MQYVYTVVLGLHVLAGVFWAGTTITLARDADIRAERFFPAQMGSAGMVFVTGALLWYFFHGAYFGGMEKTLALGIVAAITAATCSAPWSAPRSGSLPVRTQRRKPCCAPRWRRANASPPACLSSPFSAWPSRVCSEQSIQPYLNPHREPDPIIDRRVNVA
ncbi:hypothetical protein [Mesorhizobium sp. ZC-5]|uniref:hypothetical protein n=1 Tax=Mesorhizobium sp. ZC-5 TaxID=2986066 RepID=UPI0021E7611E|nr:hypothetical protein [Mesorhizobium sp. ZC-5]MCV3242294.1 hypothetical protein [Mesorhizobium sp. ZC-5]